MEFSELTEQTQKDLKAWYNVREVDIDEEDEQRLAELYEDGYFKAWDCPECGERVYKGDPAEWGHFQGVDQVDYASYPPAKDGKFAFEYAILLCDSCRCHKQHMTATGETWFNDDTDY